MSKPKKVVYISAVTGQFVTPDGNFFLKNKRYSKALLVKGDPYKFIDEVAKAGYATAPDYATILKSVAKLIEKNI